MRNHRSLHSSSFLIGLLASLPLIACGGSEPLPPPPPPVSVAPPPPPAPTPAPAAATAPAPAAEAPPEPPKPKLNHRHPVVALFLASLDSVELTIQQKTTVDGIKADLAKHAEAAKEPREKLEADVEAGVIAGKLEQAKIDADIKAMSAAAAATQTAMQDDMNRLHEALNPEQRKKLIETAREKGKEMREHGMEMHEHGGMHGDMHGDHEHGAKGMWEGPLDKLGEELSLTPDQATKLKAKVEALVKAQQAAMKNTMAATEKHFAAVGTAFEADKFDAKKAGVGSQAPDLVKAIATDRVQFVQAVLSVLTAEQRPKFLAHIQAHHADMD